MQQITNVQRNTAYCMLYGNFFILFLLKQMKFKVVKGFESQVLYEIENNLFAIRLIIDRIPEFQGFQQNLVKCLKLITELKVAHPHSFGCVGSMTYIIFQRNGNFSERSN